MDPTPQGKTPPGYLLQSTGNGFVYEGPMAIDTAGRDGFAVNIWNWARRRWNAESNRPIEKRRVRVTVEDLEAE